MSWTGAQPPQQQPSPQPKRRTGTPQVVIGIVVIVLVLLGRARSSAVPSDPAALAGYLFFNLAMVAGGVVLIVTGSRIKSRNRSADLAGRQPPIGWPVQPAPYGQQPDQFGQPVQFGQAGQYGQPGSNVPLGPYGQPDQTHGSWPSGQPEDPGQQGQ